MLSDLMLRCRFLIPFCIFPKRYLAQKCSAEELKKNMEDVAEHLLMVVQVWGLCRRRSDENMKAEDARDLLAQVDEKYLHRNLSAIADDILYNDSVKIHNTGL